MRSVADHQEKKGYYLCRYTDRAATATKDKFRGVRTYVEPYAASGICEDRKTGVLSWGSALVAVQVDNPFDLYVLNDIDPQATAALATRVERLGASVGVGLSARSHLRGRTSAGGRDPGDSRARWRPQDRHHDG